ncbi:MAG: hypothetical protein ACI8QC_003990 [Planctomycetota bacterium]|jgi:hypothetical protein
MQPGEYAVTWAAQVIASQDGIMYATEVQSPGTQKRIVLPAGRVDVSIGAERRQASITVGDESVLRFGESD